MTIYISLVAWAVAQIGKVVVQSLRQKKFTWNYFIGSGGMPSSHSATVSALVITLYLNEASGSPLLAVALVFSLIVAYDAVTLRMVVQKQSQMLNRLRQNMPAETQGLYPLLSERVGHSLPEMFAGTLLGVAVALLFRIIS